MNVPWTRFDQFGFSVSFICAVHCLAMPFLLAMVPYLGSTFIAGDKMEMVMICITLSVAVPTLFRGYLKHRRLLIPACFILGMLFLTLRPGSFEHTHDHFHSEDSLHFILAALGGFSLAIGHWFNLKFCRLCSSCRDESDTGK